MSTYSSFFTIEPIGLGSSSACPARYLNVRLEVARVLIPVRVVELHYQHSTELESCICLLSYIGADDTI